jgi:hypothetical protein
MRREKVAAISIILLQAAGGPADLTIGPVFFRWRRESDWNIEHAPLDRDGAVGRPAQLRQASGLGVGGAFQEPAIEADDGIGPEARGGALENVKPVLAIDFGMRFVEGDQSA